MIRINLLKPEPRSAGSRPRPQSHWTSRRELWMAIVLLGAGMALLFYMATRTRHQPAQPTSRSEQPPAPSRDREGADPSPPPPPEPPANSTARATDLSIKHQPESLIIALHLTGPVQYKSTKMNTPNRLVIDVSNCELALPREQLRQTVDHPEVKRVRAAQFQMDPPTCRVVLDVTSFPRYRIQAGAQALEIRIPGAGP